MATVQGEKIMWQNPLIAAFGAFLIVVASLAILTGLFKLYDVCTYGYAPDFDSIEDLVNYNLDRSRKHLEHAHEELFQQEAFTVCERINYVKRWWGEE
jgi:hypothetical protein